jgi:hypothetical protein
MSKLMGRNIKQAHRKEKKKKEKRKKVIVVGMTMTFLL